MLGFSRTQLIVLVGAALVAALSTSIQYAGARLAPPLTLVSEADPTQAGGRTGLAAALEERTGLGPAVAHAASTVAAPAAASSERNRDLNLMTYDDFLALPGIGPVIAQRIIAYRTERGRFDRVEQLLEIKGIGPATYAKLLPLVTVGPPDPPAPGDDELVGAPGVSR